MTVTDWRNLAVASALQAAAALGLRLAALPALRRWSSRLRPLARHLVKGPEERVIWAIEASGRRLPGVSTCLVRAIVADLLLSTPDRPLRLTIGVRRGASGTVEAHAWLAHGTRVIVGGLESTEYTRFVSWEGWSA